MALGDKVPLGAVVALGALDPLGAVVALGAEVGELVPLGDFKNLP